MREYQVEGLRWMVSRLGDSGVNAILADEMVRACCAREGRTVNHCACTGSTWLANILWHDCSSVVFQQLPCLRMLDAAPKVHAPTGQESAAYACMHMIV